MRPLAGPRVLGGGGAGDSDGRGGLWPAQRRDRRERDTAQVVPLVSEASASAAGTEDNAGAPPAQAAAEVTAALDGQQPSEGSPYSGLRPHAGAVCQAPVEQPAAEAQHALASGPGGSPPSPHVVARPDPHDAGPVVSGPGSSLASGSRTGGREGDTLVCRTMPQPPAGAPSDPCGQGASEGGPWGDQGARDCMQRAVRAPCWLFMQGEGPRGRQP